MIRSVQIFSEIMRIHLKGTNVLLTENDVAILFKSYYERAYNITVITTGQSNQPLGILQQQLQPTQLNLVCYLAWRLGVEDAIYNNPEIRSLGYFHLLDNTGQPKPIAFLPSTQLPLFNYPNLALSIHMYTIVKKIRAALFKNVAMTPETENDIANIFQTISNKTEPLRSIKTPNNDLVKILIDKILEEKINDKRPKLNRLITEYVLLTQHLNHLQFYKDVLIYFRQDGTAIKFYEKRMAETLYENNKGPSQPITYQYPIQTTTSSEPFPLLDLTNLPQDVTSGQPDLPMNFTDQNLDLSDLGFGKPT